MAFNIIELSEFVVKAADQLKVLARDPNAVKAFVGDCVERYDAAPAAAKRDVFLSVVMGIGAGLLKDHPWFDPARGARRASYDVAKVLDLKRYKALKGL